MSDGKTRPIINLSDVPLRDGGNGKEFQAKIGSFARSIGSTGIGAMLHVVEPGNKAFPFHNHHGIHELFVILEGTGTYRFGNERYEVKVGDVLAAPTGGPETAHQLINTGTTTLKYLGISAAVGESQVVEYPDSGKFAVTSRYDWATGKGGIRYIGRQVNSLDYWEGEK
jgi:uncharacterized cupin superfamily protein